MVGAESTITRPRLESLLDDGARRRLVTVVADAGFGKSTLLGSWAASRHCAWYPVSAERGLTSMVAGLVDALRGPEPEAAAAIAAALQGPLGPEADGEELALAYAEAAAEALQQHLTDGLVLILDDVQELRPGEPATRMLEGLVRLAPAALHLVLSSRTGIPFGIDRLRGRGQVIEIEGPELAFTVDETSTLLRAVLGEETEALAEPLQAAVHGWPAATRLAVEGLRAVPGEQRTDRLGRVLRPDGPVYDFLAEEIFAAEPAEVRRLVSVVAGLPRFGPAVCEALGIPRVAETIAELNSRGLLVPSSEPESYQLNPLVRDFAMARMPTDPAERPDIGRRAGEWFEAAGADQDALSSFLGFGDAPAAVGLLRNRGEAMIASGAAEAVVRGIETLTSPAPKSTPRPPEPTDRRQPGPSDRAGSGGSGDVEVGWLDRIEGEARQVLGDWEGAQRCFARVAGVDGPMPAGVAYRWGLIHHLRGYYDRAIETYRRGVIDGSVLVDEALLQAWWAGAHWLRGEIDECRRLTAGAMAAAQLCGDDRALAAAHTAAAMLAAVDSDPRGNATHYRRALAHAERAGDVLQSIRIRVNRGSHHIGEGRYAEGIAELDIAIGLADVSGFAVYRALAMNNRGEALIRLGRLDEAIAELTASRAIYQRLESKRVSQPLANLGEVYRERGDLAMARACYEEAIATATDTRDIQSLVPSLAGLALVLVTDEPDRAVELAGMARRAVSFGPVPGQPGALVALGWVTLHHGEPAEAAAAADEAAALSRRRRDRAGLASALELKAAAETHILRPATSLGTAEQSLLEALSIRREIGDPLGEARAELMLAQRSTGKEAREYAARAHERFVAAGATRYAAAAVLAGERSSPPAVRLECLGGFRVLRDGQPVRLNEWPSKKARDLLKILVARRCHPIARPSLIELLWPDETDESALSARLSVALSTVRSVLDPQKRYRTDHFVGADRSTIWLEALALAIDVEDFLRDARAGLEASAAGRPGQTLLLLRAAEASYAGDFLEEDVYADWASGLRDEARSTYIRVARGLADHATSMDDHDAAAGYLLRILQRDPYDERAHLALVGSFVTGGAHGESRRAYRNYVLRMEELGVEPAPFPADRPVKAV